MTVTTIWTDSFDHLDTGDAVIKYLGSTGVINTMSTDTRWGQGRAASEVRVLRSGPQTARSAWVVGLAYRPTAYDATIAQLLNISNQVQAELILGTGGFLEVNSGGSQIAQGTNPPKFGVWNYIEWALFIDNATGSSEVRLNGGLVDSTFNGDTQGQADNTATRYQIGHDLAPNNRGEIDDLYVRSGDTLDGSTDFLGDTRVRAIYPTAAGAFATWTPDSGNNHERVNEELSDQDTSYVETSTGGNRDSYVYEDIPTNATVLSLQPTAHAKRVGAGSTIAMSARISSTNYDGTPQTTTTVYVPEFDLWLESPATTSPWTAPEVNGAEYGILKG